MRTLSLACLATLFVVPPGLPNEKSSAPAVTIGKYKDLAEVVLKNRGKVVVVDFWSTS
jgi:hypothetical protein